MNPLPGILPETIVPVETLELQVVPGMLVVPVCCNKIMLLAVTRVEDTLAVVPPTAIMNCPTGAEPIDAGDELDKPEVAVVNNEATRPLTVDVPLTREVVATSLLIVDVPETNKFATELVPVLTTPAE